MGRLPSRSVGVSTESQQVGSYNDAAHWSLSIAHTQLHTRWLPAYPHSTPGTAGSKPSSRVGKSRPQISTYPGSEGLGLTSPDHTSPWLGLPTPQSSCPGQPCLGSDLGLAQRSRWRAVGRRGPTRLVLNSLYHLVQTPATTHFWAGGAASLAFIQSWQSSPQLRGTGWASGVLSGGFPGEWTGP